MCHLLPTGGSAKGFDAEVPCPWTLYAGLWGRLLFLPLPHVSLAAHGGPWEMPSMESPGALRWVAIELGPAPAVLSALSATRKKKRCVGRQGATGWLEQQPRKKGKEWHWTGRKREGARKGDGAQCKEEDRGGQREDWGERKRNDGLELFVGHFMLSTHPMGVLQGADNHFSLASPSRQGTWNKPMRSCGP